MNLLKNLASCACAGAAGLLLVASARAQTIQNPSFEADTFTVFPGYVSGNGPITGWTGTPADRVGINPGGGVPFANNGVIPHGANVAFIQSFAGGAAVLSTTIADLTPGETYTVNFRFNARVNTPAQTPVLKIGVDDQRIVNISTTAVGGTAAYRFAAFNFTASAATAVLALTNDVNGDTTLLVDAFSINVSTSGWSYAQWSDDATSGVDSSKTYTHAYNFGPAGVADATINGVTFKGLGGGNPFVQNEFSMSGIGSIIGNDDSNTPVSSGGGSASLARRFIYGGNPGTFNIANLVPGREYVATLYSVAWEAGIRAETFSVGNDRITVDQDHFGNDQGIRISYRYIAPASGTITIFQTPTLPASSLHTYGLANYEVTTPEIPVVGRQPRSQVTTPGSTATFSFTATGTRPLYFQWLKDGELLANQTNRFLTVSGITADNLGSYSVVVSNANGLATSTAASLTFGAIANPSFEADVFHTFPGYASVNTPISGWTGTTNRTGVNGPEDWRNVGFANSGVPADGDQVGFIQSTAVNWLSTTLNGLTPGQLYNLKFRVNGRSGYGAAALRVAVDSQVLLDGRVNAVGGTNVYRTVSLEFTPTVANPTLWLTNDMTADTALLIDDFRVTPIATPSKWTIAAWNDDASAGVDNTKFYTHAYKFGRDNVDAVVSNVTFKALPGANPSVAGQFITAGFPTVFTGDDANVLTAAGGGSALLAQVFIYNSGVQTITLTNLQPGMQYVATIYSVAWDPTAFGRSATFVYKDDSKTFNQDHFGENVGIRFSYPYTADESGTATFTMIPTDSASTIHTYGFANYQAMNSAPVIAAQPRNQFVGAGDPATLFVALGAGSQPTFYQWRRGETDLVNETNTTLTLTDLNTFGLTDYTVVVSNALGVVTSAVARVEVGLRMAEVYNTGVDDSGALLADNDIDPHYSVVSSSDPAAPGPNAFVMLDNQFPIVVGTYITNGPLSKWITVSTNAIAGTYVYRTSFILDTVDPAHSQITGRWASDNEGLDIRLNGVSLGISNLSVRPFGEWFPIVISSGFVAGSNTVEFVISNQPPVGYTAFRAELYGVGRPLPPGPPQIVTQPASLLVSELDDVALSVVASGSGPLTYQWSYFGFDLQNETNRTLRLTRVSFDQGGDYKVRVINAEGNVLSDAAVLTVNARPTANTDYIASAQDTAVSIPVSKFLYNDEDLDGMIAGITSVSAVSTNGGTVVLSANVITYTPPAGYTGPDEFTYTVADNQNGTATGTVVVTVGATTFVTIVSPPAMQLNGEFTVGFAGVPGYPYTIETATSVVGPWEVLTTIVADQDGKFNVTDPNTEQSPIRFYRAMYP